MATTTTYTISATRIITQIPSPYSSVVTRLHSSLGSTSKWPPADPSPLASGKAGIERIVTEAAGPHDFLLFQQYDWLPLLSAYDVGTGRQAKRVIFGNPLVALTMTKWDVKAALFAPVSMLVMETEEGSTECMYDLPSSLIVWDGSDNREELESAAKKLDEKMRVFVAYLGEQQ